MRFKNFIFILALFMILLCCFSAVGASENVDDSVSVSDDVAMDEVVSEVDSDDESISVQENEEIESSDDVDNESLEVSDVEEVDDVDDSSSVLSAEENENEVSGQTPEDNSYYEINVTTDDGTVGDYEQGTDPLYLAVNKINENENIQNVTLNIANGRYQMFPTDMFYLNNVKNMVVNGDGNEVIIEPLMPEIELNRYFGFEHSANVIFNNIIFDMSSLEEGDFAGACSELPVTYNECTFIGGSNSLFGNIADTRYINCAFYNFTSDYLFDGLTSKFAYFENCVFSNLNAIRLSRLGSLTSYQRGEYNYTFNGVWFGNNQIPTYITSYPAIVNSPGFTLPIDKYALFTSFEKYLGNNQYEIVGKLTWNGTDSSEGMENFPPMTVTLTSATGEIQNATLVNGTFKAIYTSESSEHNVTVKLDSEEINLTFANIALNLNNPTINYGENQNIVVNLSKPVTGIITVSVNGKNYPVNIDNSDSITVPIDETLNVGTHNVNVTFIDEENHIYGSNTIKITISPIKIKTNITIPEIVAGKATTTTITLPQNATGNVTVIVDGNISSVENLTNGSATVTIPELSAGKHNVTISYSGDDNYAGFAQTSAVEVKEPAKPTTQPDDQKPATTKKTATKITAKKKTFKAKTKVKKYTITLKAGKKAVKKVQVILKIGKKIFKAKTNAKGKATFKIKKLTKKGKYNAKITFKGNKLYKASSKKVKITVKK